MMFLNAPKRHLKHSQLIHQRFYNPKSNRIQHKIEQNRTFNIIYKGGALEWLLSHLQRPNTIAGHGYHVLTKRVNVMNRLKDPWSASSDF